MLSRNGCYAKAPEVVPVPVEERGDEEGRDLDAVLLDELDVPAQELLVLEEPDATFRVLEVSLDVQREAGDLAAHPWGRFVA